MQYRAVLDVPPGWVGVGEGVGETDPGVGEVGSGMVDPGEVAVGAPGPPAVAVISGTAPVVGEAAGACAVLVARARVGTSEAWEVLVGVLVGVVDAVGVDVRGGGAVGMVWNKGCAQALRAGKYPMTRMARSKAVTRKPFR